MTRRVRKRTCTRLLSLWCVAAFAASAAFGVTGVVSRPSAGALESPGPGGQSTSPYFTFSVTPTQDLVDGERMTVTVTRTQVGTAAGIEILRVEPGWCAAGTQLPTSISAAPYGPGTNFPTGLGKTVLCTTDTFPLNGDPQPISTISPPVKATGNYTSVSGLTFAQSSEGTKVRWGTLACDATSPCTFVLAVYAKVDTTLDSTRAIYFLKVPVTYQATVVESACGGAAPGELTAVGPDRLGGFSTDETRAACATSVGGGKALVNALSSGQSDAQALCAFASGRADLAYSAVGYGTSSSPFNPWNCTTDSGGPQPQRPFVAVPIALDSVDVDHTQTSIVLNASNSDSFADYKQLDITDAQAAQLLSAAGTGLWSFALGSGILKEDPTLTDDFFYYPSRPINHNNLVSGVDGPVVTSGAQATSYFATTYFHALDGQTMLSPTTGSPGLGVVANFGTAIPRYAVDPVTGLVNIVHALTPSRSFGGMPFALLPGADTAAVWFGMDAMALQTPSSIGRTPVYVAPTTETMQAAVPTMTAGADGMLEPNPHAAATSSPAYPLTYVEYAIAPAQPLETTGCSTPRTTSQADLTDWLDYLVGPGQSALPPGMAPLTATLLAQAQADIAKVGASPCAPVPPPPAHTTPTGSVPGPGTTAGKGTGKGTSKGTGKGTTGSSSATGVTGYASASSGGVTTVSTGSTGLAGEGTAGAGAASTKTGTSSSSTKAGTSVPSAQPAIDASLAHFVGRTSSSWFFSAAGLLFLFALLPALALVASGRVGAGDVSRLVSRLARTRGRRRSVG